MYSYKNICQHFFAFLRKKIKKLFKGPMPGQNISRWSDRYLLWEGWEYVFNGKKCEKFCNAGSRVDSISAHDWRW